MIFFEYFLIKVDEGKLRVIHHIEREISGERRSRVPYIEIDTLISRRGNEPQASLSCFISKFDSKVKYENIFKVI